MNKFDRFISSVGSVKSADQLCGLICSLGLVKDPRGLYGRYNEFQVPVGGAWQDPYELARFLWDSKDDFEGCTSFLEIGTYTGYTFFIITNFLRAHVCPTLRCKTIDPCANYIDPAIWPYVQEHFQLATSEDVKGEQYDIVLIDGNHEGEWPLLDFNNCSKGARIVVFHDIVDKWCPAVRNTFETLKMRCESKEYVFSHDGNTFGIGVIFEPGT
jgi:hypothetical protein